MADYWDTFDPDPVVSMPAYLVACKFCGVDLYGRHGDHLPPCPRSGRRSAFELFRQSDDNLPHLLDVAVQILRDKGLFEAYEEADRG